MTITPTFKDLVTGDIRKPREGFGDVYWWTEGNGSCDCNRARLFDGADEEMDAAMRAKHPELEPHQSYCYGCQRFIAVDVEGDFEGLTKNELLAELNREYKI